MTDTNERTTLTLMQLQQRFTALITVAATRDVWVTAELSDVATRGGHCYMELLQKDTAGVNTVARARGIIWANTYRVLLSKFYAATGREFASGIKVMLKVTANYHPVYGFSLLVSDVDPSYTLGDHLRVRREILERLKREGVLELNRSIAWPDIVQRVAIVSAPGAAGYGDFINQLLCNPSRLRFDVALFPAVMQGDRSADSIISALHQVATDERDWDCVVVIRGGGATSDLASFDNYELAATIAMFPIPVIIGIGHERDVTVLDYVANMRVKTPTAAAEWLISRGEDALHRLRDIVSEIALTIRDRLAGSHTRLAFIEGQLPVIPFQALQRQHNRILTALTSLGHAAARIEPQQMRLDSLQQALLTAVGTITHRQTTRLDALGSLADALSPEATLRRGFSTTRIGGKTLRSAADATAGAQIETILAYGSIISTVNNIIPTEE